MQIPMYITIIFFLNINYSSQNTQAIGIINMVSIRKIKSFKMRKNICFKSTSSDN